MDLEIGVDYQEFSHECDIKFNLHLTMDDLMHPQVWFFSLGRQLVTSL
jgi:hypothetical protein